MAINDRLQSRRHLSSAELGETEMMYDYLFFLTQITLVLDNSFAIHIFQMTATNVTVLEAGEVLVDGVKGI